MVTSVFEKLASSNFRIGEGNGFPKNISKILEAMTCKRSDVFHRERKMRRR
jgi:hypothetical protein